MAFGGMSARSLGQRQIIGGCFKLNGKGLSFDSASPWLMLVKGAMFEASPPQASRHQQPLQKAEKAEKLIVGNFLLKSLLVKQQ